MERLELEVGLRETEVDSVGWKSMVVLLPRKAFFLRGSDDLAVNHQRGGRIVIKGREPQNGRHAMTALWRSVDIAIPGEHGSIIIS